MMRIVSSISLFVALTVAAGCGSKTADPVSKAESYKALAKADEAFADKRYSEAVPLFDEAIKSGSVQADILAEIYVKRATCKIETGDLDGASADLEQADRGGAVGEEYQRVQKKLSEKRSGS